MTAHEQRQPEPDDSDVADAAPPIGADTSEPAPESNLTLHVAIDATFEIEIESEPERTSRDVLFESIGLQLVGAGVLTPVRDFVAEVRASAGTRISPRDIAAIVTQVGLSGAEVSAAAVAEIASSSTGGRSQRQQRNSDQWRALGAALTLRDLDGSAEGQRAFIGEARRVVGKDGSDALVLQIALALADIGATFDAETVGKLGKRLALSAPDIHPDSMKDIVHAELRSLHRAERSEAISKRKNRSSSGERRASSNYLSNPGARKLRPGRRNIRSFPEKGTGEG